MKKLFGALLVIAIFITACNKDQQTVNKLEGTWNITASTWDSAGTTVDLWAAMQLMGISSASAEYGDCKISDGNCTGYMTTSGTDPFFGMPYSSTDTFSYTVSDKGGKYTQDDQIWDIIEHSKTTFKVSQTDNDVVTEMTLTKQ